MSAERMIEPSFLEQADGAFDVICPRCGFVTWAAYAEHAAILAERHDAECERLP